MKASTRILQIMAALLVVIHFAIKSHLADSWKDFVAQAESNILFYVAYDLRNEKKIPTHTLSKALTLLNTSTFINNENAHSLITERLETAMNLSESLRLNDGVAEHNWGSYEAWHERWSSRVGLLYNNNLINIAVALALLSLVLNRLVDKLRSPKRVNNGITRPTCKCCDIRSPLKTEESK